MKTFTIVLACIIVYVLMAMFTIFLMILDDRLEGNTPDDCYNAHFGDYVCSGLVLWWIILPLFMICLICTGFKKYLVFLV